MSTELGFIKLERGIVDHWVFTKDPEFRIWVYLIFLAKFSASKKPVIIGNQERVLDRGEFITSTDKVAAELGLKYNQVRRCLDLFKKNDMIRKTVGRGKNIPYVAKIVNYDKWQGEYTIKTQSKNIQKTFKTQHTNNYNNEYKEITYWLYKCEVCDIVVVPKSEFSDLVCYCKKCDHKAVRHKL
tara:strand:+ start:3491 stop:4042 length:552 start_codon:yes stop_codon:yes gene_type:complete